MENFSSLQSFFFLFLSYFLCFSATTSSAVVLESKPTKQIESAVHDLLPKFGLPKGLLPDVVKSYSLSDDGGFSIELLRACYVQFDDLVYYDKKIVGKLTYGSISDLSGIQAKKLFVWVPVTGIEVDSAADLIEFHVGFLSEKLPAKQFENIPTCKNKACRGSGMIQQEYALEMGKEEATLEIVELEPALEMDQGEAVLQESALEIDELEPALEIVELEPALEMAQGEAAIVEKWEWELQPEVNRSYLL